MKTIYSDNEIIEAFRNNNSKVLTYFYKTNYPVIQYIILKNNGSEEDVKDIFQETCEIIFEYLKNDKFKLTCSLRSFLYSVSYKKWLKELRVRKKKTNFISDYSSQNFNNAYQIPEEFYDILDMKLSESLFKKHFYAIKSDCQKILSMDLDGKKNTEIAKELKFTENFIKKRKSLCKKDLINRIMGDPLFNEISGESVYDINLHDLIDSYLKNEMPKEQIPEFEQSLLHNQNLQYQLDFQRMINNSIPSYDTLLFRLNLNEIHENLSQTNSLLNNEESAEELERIKKIFNNPTITNRFSISSKAFLFSAASILIILTLVFIFKLISFPGNEKLFTQYFSKYETMGDIRNIYQERTSFDLGLKYYDKDYYYKAIDELNKINKSDDLYHAAQFYIAISYLEIDNPEKAIKILSVLAADKKHSYYYQSNWFLSLSYLKTNDFEKARHYLLKIIKSDNPYKEKATELFDSIQ